MHTIEADITGKVLTIAGDPVIVCGNSDYELGFSMDEEFLAFDEYTLRITFRHNGILQHYDVLFTGNTVPIPALPNTDCIAVGVYAGNICSTTAAVIPCSYSAGTDHPYPPPDVYSQLMEYLAGLHGGGFSSGVPLPIISGTIDSANGNPEVVEEES